MLDAGGDLLVFFVASSVVPVVERLELDGKIACVVHQPLSNQRAHIFVADGGQDVDKVAHEVALALQQEEARWIDEPPLRNLRHRGKVATKDAAPLFRPEDGLLDLTTLDYIIAPACRAAAHDASANLKPLSSYFSSNGEKAPARDKTYIMWARTSAEMDRQHVASVKLAMKALSLLVSPPPTIASGLSNVKKVCLVLEMCSTWLRPLKDREAWRYVREQAKDGETVVAATNLDRMTRRAEEVVQLVTHATSSQSELWCHAMSANQTEGDTGEERWDRLDATTQVQAETHLKHATLLSAQAAFHGNSAQLITSILHHLTTAADETPELQLVDAFREFISHAAARNRACATVLYSRTSQESPNSLSFQTALVEAQSPPSLPGNKLALRGASAASGAVCMAALAREGFRNALILFTSTDRLLRRKQDVEGVVDQARQRNLAYVGLVWTGPQTATRFSFRSPRTPSPSCQSFAFSLATHGR